MPNSKKTAPALYSPLKVVFLSFLFTPIFGGYLQSKNWEALGEKTFARLSSMWVRTTIWLVVLYVVMQTIFVDEPLMKYSGLLSLSSVVSVVSFLGDETDSLCERGLWRQVGG